MSPAAWDVAGRLGCRRPAWDVAGRPGLTLAGGVGPSGMHGRRQPHERGIDAEHARHELWRQRRLGRPIRNDATPIEQDEARKIASRQADVVEDGDDGDAVSLGEVAQRTKGRPASESSRASRPTWSLRPTRSMAAATAARSAGRWPRKGSSWG